MRVLGIESSCDELAFAILDKDGKRTLANVVHTQIDLHKKFGGIVPEIASRDHVRRLTSVFSATLDSASCTLDDINGIAVTSGPGLIGALLCGLEFGKGLALATNKPFVGINHLEGHIAAAFLEDKVPDGPFVALLVSGGHTHLYLVEELGAPYMLIGATRDDAAGEAFDKTAKLLGLGYPGGVQIDRHATGGDPKRFAFPEMMKGKDNFDFSFSGLKTAALRAIKANGGDFEGDELRDFCAGFQNAIVTNLLGKAFRAAYRTGTKRLVLAGGVAANSELRRRATEKGLLEGIEVHLPSKKNCTDNAAMIARAGWVHLRRGACSPFDLSASPNWPLTKTKWAGKSVEAQLRS